MKRTPKAKRRLPRIRQHPVLILVPALLIAVTLVVVLFRREIWGIFASPERIEAAVVSWGAWGPLLFIVLQFVQVVIFVIPGEIPQIAGGYLFGLFPGSAYSIVGILIGSSFNFLLARLLGVPFVRAIFREEQIGSFDRIAHSARAQIAFFLLFVIPGIPKDILCYVAGLSPLRFGAFILISTVGRIPGIVGSAAMGNAAASREWVLALVLLGIATLLFVLGLIYRNRIHSLIERFALQSSPENSRGRAAQHPDPGPSADMQDT